MTHDPEKGVTNIQSCPGFNHMVKMRKIKNIELLIKEL